MISGEQGKSPGCPALKVPVAFSIPDLWAMFVQGIGKSIKRLALCVASGRLKSGVIQWIGEAIQLLTTWYQFWEKDHLKESC